MLPLLPAKTCSSAGWELWGELEGLAGPGWFELVLWGRDCLLKQSHDRWMFTQPCSLALSNAKQLECAAIFHPHRLRWEECVVKRQPQTISHFLGFRPRDSLLLWATQSCQWSITMHVIQLTFCDQVSRPADYENKICGGFVIFVYFFFQIPLPLEIAG